MDEETKRAYIQLRLDKAREDLHVARDILTKGYLRTAVNRAYYTVFHAASAALLWSDVERARHSGIQSALGEHLIRTGILNQELGRIFSKARKMREEQDYELILDPLNEEEVETMVQEAGLFVSKVEQYLREVGAIE